MGNSKKEPSPRIVEFLYRDMERLTSLYAQHFGGNLLEIASMSSGSETGVNHIGGSVAVFGGHIEQSSTNTVGETHKSDPHDMRILKLLNELSLPVTRAHLSGLIEGKILILQGELYIRSYALINEVMDLIAVPEIAKQIPEFHDASISLSAIKAMLNSLPLGLELELENSKAQRLVGPMRPEALLIPPNDLMRTYGTKVPGEWYVLGIVDAINTRSAMSESDELSALLDHFAEIAATIMRPQKVMHRIIPILIYRYLEREQ